MLHEKPPGPMHEALRRAMDELKTHNNPYGCINYITSVLTNSEKPALPSGADYANAPNAEATPSTNASGGNTSNGKAGSSGGGGLATAGSWMGVGVSAIEFQGAVSAARPPLSPDPTSRSPAKPATVTSTVNTHAPSVAMGILAPTESSAASPSAAVEGTGAARAAAADPTVRHRLNATEVVRLLLLRAEAFGVTKQHEKALIDAKSALEMSRGQSPEAHFCVGREHRRLFHIPESVDAFDMGEAMLRSIQQSLRSDTREAFDAGIKETTTDEDFWAQRGYTEADVASLGISRSEFELQEQAVIQRRGAATNRLATGSLVVPGSPGAAAAAARRAAEEEDALAEARAPPVSLSLDAGADASSAAAGAGDAAVPSSNASWANQTGAGAAMGSGNGGAGGGINSNLLEDLLFLRTGISTAELAMWRRLSNEAHALLAMRSSHTVPVSVHQTSLTMLERSLTGVRGGLTLSVDNGTGSALRFVGAAAPDAQYAKSFSFPEVIPKGHCGMAMLQPRGWGGYSGCVCYELVDAVYPVSLIITFENPMMGSAKFGVRFIENAFPSDLRRAFADTNGGSNQGILGAPTNTHVPHSAAAAEKGAVPPTATIRSASRANASKAVRMPPNSVWVSSHRATFGRRSVKASTFTMGTQTICVSLSEMQTLKMRSIEILGALEYAGPQTLKKVSAVSRRYRALINNLPPTLFYGAGRRAYPDYTLMSDRDASPWVVCGKDAITWRIVFEGRVLEREELSVVCDVDAQTTSRPILTISVESHARVASQLYYGDKRSPQLTLKESWVPFSNSMYLATPLGRTFGVCNNDNQGQFTLTVGGANPNKSDEPLYTARKKTADGARTSGSATSTGVLPSSAAYVDPMLAGSYSATALNGMGTSPTASHSGSGLGGTAQATSTTSNNARRAGNPVGVSVSPLAFMADKGSGGIVAPTVRGSTGTTAAGRTALSGAGGSTASLNSLSSAAGAKGGARQGNSLAHLTRGDHYTFWRSQHVSGAAIPNTPARRTNQGAQIVAEVRVAPQGLHALTRGYTIAEIRLLPGADALLATVLAFCIARW